METSIMFLVKSIQSLQKFVSERIKVVELKDLKMICELFYFM